LATAAMTYRADHGRFPKDQFELKTSNLVSSEFFSAYGYTIAYLDDGPKHFIAIAQAAGKDFCTDESQTVRAGEISKDDRCTGTELK